VVAFLFSALSLRQPITGYLETVIPAKAGTHAERIDTQLGARCSNGVWVPAFAGMTF
jgi:hypothetical protein